MFNYINCSRSGKRKTPEEMNADPVDPKKNKHADPTVTQEAPIGEGDTGTDSTLGGLDTTCKGEGTAGALAASTIQSQNLARHVEKGYMWEMRHRILCEPEKDSVFHQEKFLINRDETDDQIGLAQFSSDEWEVAEYQVGLPREEQDTLTKYMTSLQILARKQETDMEKGLENELDPTIWEFVKMPL